MSFGIRNALTPLRKVVTNVSPSEERECDLAELELLNRESEYVAYLTQIRAELLTDADKEIRSARVQIMLRQALLSELCAEFRAREVTRKTGPTQTELQRLEEKLKLLIKERDPLNSAAEFFRMQYREILRVPRVSSAWVVPPRLVYRTDELFGRDHRSLWRRIGPFEISFDLINPSCSTMQWQNLEGPIGGWHGPPNIANNQEKNIGFVSCMGTEASNIVSAARENYDYVSIVALSVRYAECPGHISNVSIEKWPVVPGDELPPWYRETF